MTVAAGNLPRNELRSLDRSIGEYSKAPANVVREPRVIERGIRQRILREFPCRHHRGSRRYQGTAERQARNRTCVLVLKARARPCVYKDDERETVSKSFHGFQCLNSLA